MSLALIAAQVFGLVSSPAPGGKDAIVTLARDAHDMTSQTGAQSDMCTSSRAQVPPPGHILDFVARATILPKALFVKMEPVYILPNGARAALTPSFTCRIFVNLCHFGLHLSSVALIFDI